jgi:uncharacterized protein (DUF58 family)
MDAANIDVLSAAGVAADTDYLLKLRHLVHNLPERRLAPTGMPGGFVSRRRGRGLETVDIRIFSEGDDIRHLDHNTSARTGVPHVRTFRDERERSVLLLADFRPPMLWGTRRVLRSVAAAEVLALAGWRVIEAGGRVGLIAFGAGEPIFVPARGRERGMVAVIGALTRAHRAALEAASETHAAEGRPLEDVIELAARLVPTGGSVFLGSGLDDPGEHFDILASALNRRAALTVLLITDAFEQRPPTGSYPFMTRIGRVGWASFLTNRFSAEPDPRIDRLAHLGIATIPVDAGQGPETMVAELEKFDGPWR